MKDIEAGVSEHYSAYDVLSQIKTGLAAVGHTGDRIPPDALKAVDEFHIGGAEATLALLADLDLRSGMRVLDIGSGIGGPARLVATHCGCHVTGVDLTPGFVEAARALSEMTGMAGQVEFKVGSATSLPLPDASFDLALLLHVGMNIPDKAELFRQARRVLRDSGVFAIYEVMKVGDGALAYPVPWATTEDLSALAAPDVYREAAAAAGFKLISEKDRSGIALDFFARIQAQAAAAKPAPLGLHLLMGPTVKERTSNMVAALRAGTIAPIQMIFHAGPARGAHHG